MELIKNDDSTWTLSKVSELEQLMLSRIPESADPNGCERALDRLYPSPIAPDANLEAEKSFDLLDCKGIARVDFRFNKEDKNNKIYMLEINTQPGLTDTSLFPKIAINAGIDFPDLIEWIVKDAGVNR